MEKGSTEKLKSSRLMSKRMKWIIMTAVVVAQCARGLGVQCGIYKLEAQP